MSLPKTLLTATVAVLLGPLTVGAAQHDDGSFAIRRTAGGPSAESVREQCHVLREQCHATWLAGKPIETWRPACVVVLHSTRASYEQATGRGSRQTSGSSLVRFRQGRVIERRIDLMVGPDGNLSALAHELTHVVLAERFHGSPPPRWADEGLAVLADSDTKQALHERDCLHALQSGHALRMHELVTLNQFSSREQVAAFYGQSHSLVRYLTERHDPGLLIPFVQAAQQRGYDRALRDTYGIQGTVDLEQRWRGYALARQSTPTVLAVSTKR